MPLGTPIQFTLYGDNDEVLETYSRARVPLQIVERAIELADKLKGDTLGVEQLLALYQVVIDFYGGKFTIEDLRSGADLSELITVIESIVTRAVELMPGRPDGTSSNPSGNTLGVNPTTPPK